MVKTTPRHGGADNAHHLSRRALQSLAGALSRAHAHVERRLEPQPERRPYVASVGAAYDTGFATCPCLFVLSTGRVGTDSLAALLGCSPGITAVHEPQPKLVHASYQAYMNDANHERWRDIVLAARGEQVATSARWGNIYAETNNRMTFLAGVLSDTLPASRFIHLHRHPYEVIYSCMRRSHYAGHPWDYARIRPRAGDPYARKWDGMSVLEKVAWHWMEINRIGLEFGRQVPGDRFLNLPSKSLFHGDPETIEAIFRFAGTTTPPRERLEEVLGTPHNQQVGGAAVRTPAEWSTEQRSAVNAIVGEVAVELGYELTH